MHMTLKQSKPATNLSSAKPHLLLQCYIFFAVSIRDWFNLTYDLHSSPKLPFLCSAFSFQGDCLISPLHRSLQGQRAKGNCGKDGGEKSHTSMWTAAQAGADGRTVRPFSRWWGQLTWQKVKGGAVELYINHWSWSSLAVSVWSTGNFSRVVVSPATGMCCISSPKNGTMAQQTWKLLQLKSKEGCKMTGRKTSTLHFPENHRANTEDLEQEGTQEFSNKLPHIVKTSFPLPEGCQQSRWGHCTRLHITSVLRMHHCTNLGETHCISMSGLKRAAF